MTEATWNCGDIGKPLCSACNLPVVDLTQHPGCGAPMANLSEPKPAMTEAMDEHIERAGAEQAAWDWLDQMVSGICDEHPSDIAYSADQMVGAYCAGVTLAASEARQAEQAATIARLREALAVIAYEGPSEPDVVAHSALLASSEPLTALEDQHG